MAPPPLRKLTALQQSRFNEIQLTSTRLGERDRSAFNINIVTTRIEALTKVWNDARNTHEDIITREDVTDCPYVTDNVFANIQALFEDTLDFLLTLQSELQANIQPEVPVRTLNDSSFADFELRAAKLPKLDLPTFSGRYEDWENFCDLFTTLVHNAPRLADATKLQYLKSCLKGTAADLVKNVATTNANYATTWQALKARFHNPRLIVFNHLRALMEIPHLKKESAAGLRSFADEAQRIVRALTNLKMPVEHWDIWFVFILTARLDPESRKAWETELSVNDRNLTSNPDSDLSNENPLSRFPKFTDLAGFLENRARTLSMIASEDGSGRKSSALTGASPGARRVFHASSSHTSADGRVRCPACSGAHRLFKCYKFKAKTPYERRGEIRRLQLCFNCFGPHKVAECTSAFRCTQCKDKHHTMIHVKPSNSSQTAQVPLTDSSNARDEKSNVAPAFNVHTARLAPHKYSVVLATAQLTLVGAHGAHTRVRALLDQGSETSFVSSAIANFLKLPTQRVNIPVNGLGSSTACTARLATRFAVRSLIDPAYQLETNALILPKLTSQLPARRSLELDLNNFRDLALADPSFYVSDSVDVILGADIYGQLLRSGLRSFPSSSLIAQDTVLGWIISGPVHAEGSRRADARSRMSLRALHCAPEIKLDELLQKFWNLEEVPQATKSLTPEEQACERLFRDTHTRDADGKFVVHLPFRSEPPRVASETRRMAMSSLTHSHRRFTRDSRLAQAYGDFMAMYENLGHMERVPAAEIDSCRAWYLPHHAVVQSSPSNWKLRVVFDASRKTREKHCLNDFLMPGPVLQRDLSLILLNWRRYRFVFTADIVKMFRQIRVSPDDQDLQRIVWAPSAVETPVDYRLTTVTYGTACAPYLAIRTLEQIANEERTRFPLGANCLQYNTYVDDTFAGADELSTAMRIRHELVEILHSADIELDKWAANHLDLLPSNASRRTADEVKTLNFDESIKTLGVNWNPGQDAFKFTTLAVKDLAGAATKRSVLSGSSRLFDPLGWLAPVTVIAKILMQDLWLSKCDWDASLPADVRERWLEYCNSLSSLSELSIKRWLGVSNGSRSQIHGFSDASRRAYAAAVYIRVDEGNGRFRVSLLVAKSKVAPVKTVSIPNLELCGAALLVRLVRHIQKLDFLQGLPVRAWTDSQIVLTWLRKHPCHWKTFVANRVSFIQTELPMAVWAHVPTKENPSDLATRGCKAFDLMHATLWWHGPDWLAMPEEHWPKAALAPQALHAQATSGEPEILTRFSSLTRLTRVVAYCLRPWNRLRRRRNGLDALPNFLTASELSEARFAVIRVAQEHALAANGIACQRRNELDLYTSELASLRRALGSGC